VETEGRPAAAAQLNCGDSRGDNSSDVSHSDLNVQRVHEKGRQRTQTSYSKSRTHRPSTQATLPPEVFSPTHGSILSNSIKDTLGPSIPSLAGAPPMLNREAVHTFASFVETCARRRRGRIHLCPIFCYHRGVAGGAATEKAFFFFFAWFVRRGGARTIVALLCAACTGTARLGSTRPTTTTTTT
jgi:hypothetical protein